MSRRAKPEQIAEVVSMRPVLLRDRDAAALIARSASWIRQARSEDVKAAREGREPSGPRWITIGASVFYRLADLEAWISSHAVERGVVAFSNRGAAKP